MYNASGAKDEGVRRMSWIRDYWRALGGESFEEDEEWMGFTLKGFVFWALICLISVVGGWGLVEGIRTIPPF